MSSCKGTRAKPPLSVRAESETDDDRGSFRVQPQGRGPHLEDLPRYCKVSQPDSPASRAHTSTLGHSRQ